MSCRDAPRAVRVRVGLLGGVGVCFAWGWFFWGGCGNSRCFVCSSGFGTRVAGFRFCFPQLLRKVPAAEPPPARAALAGADAGGQEAPADQPSPGHPVPVPAPPVTCGTGCALGMATPPSVLGHPPHKPPPLVPAQDRPRCPLSPRPTRARAPRSPRPAGPGALSGDADAPEAPVAARGSTGAAREQRQRVPAPLPTRRGVTGRGGFTAPGTSQSTRTVPVGMSLLCSLPPPSCSCVRLRPPSLLLSTPPAPSGPGQHPERPQEALVKVQSVAQGREGSRWVDGALVMCTCHEPTTDSSPEIQNLFKRVQWVRAACGCVTHEFPSVSSSSHFPFCRGGSYIHLYPHLPGNESLILQQKLISLL